ncbi:DNA topoisomerase I, plasmid [uncultured delta proteobacterium]|uniref:DNA topoisomerase 1 n=1 Tax=uncultured delta proteobacterium TaxID=34034 RepID=A0A212K6Y3_9DELT|nr:DNA topoisomerase I, plasmid [uncultured delta proteobacterium]
MCSKLLILESPGKVKKVQEILGSDWKVVASVGHVRDLPIKEMGVAAPGFKPKYIPTDRGKDVLSRLAGLVKNVEAVYLATDPDREGEAIAWHIQDALKLKDAKRVTYAEITEKAIKAALDVPRSIDMALVAAQEGRRVLDRFCGYMVSGPLSNVAGEKLSAGRVQSPAVRLVVEREREIQDFRSTTHYGAELSFENVDNITDGWKATWLVKPWLEDGQEYLLDKALAEKAAALRSLEVVDCKESESRSAPPAPFTTSSLQQAASNALKFTPKQTMQLAQRLYEQGAITYMRTDSHNLSQDAGDAIRAFCEGQGWPLVENPRSWKSKEGAQEAHEAIRPTHIEIEEAGETADEKALYRLIRLRSLASQLEDAVYAVRVLQLAADLDGKQALFEAKGRTLLSQGWKVLTAGDVTADDVEDATEPENPVPAMKPGTRPTALTGTVLTKKTKPAARFTEASLIRELEKRGIGRPSTYAAILDTIMSRGYVKTEKRFLTPTPLGVMVVDKLRDNFSFVEYKFTRQMEQALDDIAAGKADYHSVISEAHARLKQELQAFAKATGKVCEKCGKPMVRRVKKPGKDGKGGYDFWGCTGWPECK